MRHFTLYDEATGCVKGTVSGANVLPPDAPHVAGMPPADGQRYKVVDGAFVVDTTPGPGPDYREQRAEAYPAIANQLDALWHAMDAGTIPMVPEFYDPIRAVKDAIPKT